MGVEADKAESTEETSADSGYSDLDSDSCGCHIWDEHSHSEHLEAFYYAAKCAHECNLEKVSINTHRIWYRHIMCSALCPFLCVLVFKPKN